MDLDAGRVVQHLQVLKHCLPDLLQVLRGRPSHRLLQVYVLSQNLQPTPCAATHLSGVLVLYPGADVRVQREVWGKVLKILCGHRGGKKGEIISFFLHLNC